MRIFTCENGQIVPRETLTEALRFERGTAAFVGGGGKSTLIAYLARELNARGARVMITTTTHIRAPKDKAAYDPADETGIAAALSRGEIATVGRNDKPGKLCGGTQEELRELRKLCDALLIEADGAHERPMKAPEEWEPVLLVQADLVIGVAGATALGMPIGACHRPQRVAAVCGKAVDHLVTPRDMARVLFSPQGQRKQVACRYEAIINQADAGERFDQAKAAALCCPRAILCGRERKMRCNGVELWVRTMGDTRNPPLLLIHGNGEDHTIFDAAVDALSKRYFVIAPDSRGHGASQPVVRYDYREMARDMAALLEALDVQNASVFGFSDGGIIALLMAIFHPQRLARVIAAGANTHPLGVRAGCFVSVLRDYIKTRDGKSALMLTQPHITRAQLRTIRLPTRILAGERDVIRPAHTRALARKIPGAQLHIVPGEDHGSYIVGSERFIQEARL